MSEKTESTVSLVVVFAILLGLVVLSWGLSHFHLGVFGTPIALVIGSLKALGIALWFMELASQFPTELAQVESV